MNNAISNVTLVWASLAFFVAFLAVAAIDGVYFHVKKFRLWAHAESRLEHGLHTVRAFTMPAMIAALFLPGRSWLISAIALFVLDCVAAVLDVAVEWKSRRRYGGLPQGEYAVHLAATLLHVAAVTLAFVARGLPVTETPSACSGCVMPVVAILVASTSLGAIHHGVLCARGAAAMPGETA